MLYDPTGLYCLGGREIYMLKKEHLTDIFFDLDHTLWDFEKNSALTFRRVFQELGVVVNIDEFVHHYAPINAYYWKCYRENKIDETTLRFNRLKDTFNQLKHEVSPELIQSISEAYIEYLCTFTHLIEGAIPLLDTLKSHYKLHVITNGFENVQRFKIINSGMISYFEQIFTAEKTGFKKPHPQIFNHAMQTTGTRPEQTLMIGDSMEADILGAMEQGMQAIHFNIHHEEIHEKCPIVYSLAEVKSLLIK